MFRVEYFFDVKLRPKKNFLAYYSFLYRWTSRNLSIFISFIFKLVLYEIGNNTDRDLLESNIDLSIDIFEIWFNEQIILFVFVQNGIDDFIFIANIEWKVISVNNILNG